MMRNKILIAAALVLPLLMQACDRSDRSPTASTPSSERQARTPSDQDRMLENRPPAAGPSQPGSSSGDTSAPSSTPGGSSTPDSSGTSGGSSGYNSPGTPGSTGSGTGTSGSSTNP